MLGQRELDALRVLLDQILKRKKVVLVNPTLAVKITCEAIVELYFRIWVFKKIGYDWDSCSGKHGAWIFIKIFNRRVVGLIEGFLDVISSDLKRGIDNFDDVYIRINRLICEFIFAQVCQSFNHEELVYLRDSKRTLHDNLYALSFEKLLTENGDGFIIERDELRRVFFSIVIQYYGWVFDGARSKTRRDVQAKRNPEKQKEIKTSGPASLAEPEFNGVVAAYFTPGAWGWIGGKSFNVDLANQ